MRKREREIEKERERKREREREGGGGVGGWDLPHLFISHERIFLIVYDNIEELSVYTQH